MGNRSRKIQPSIVFLHGILIFCILTADAMQAIAKQPLFEAYRRIIVLDPGHGGRDIGAQGADGTAEKAVALELAKFIDVELQRDYKVTLTRSDDYNVELDNRSALANHLKADVFVSLHTAGSFVYSTSGTIIYHYQKASNASLAPDEDPVLQSESENIPIPWEHSQKSSLGKSRILAQIISSRLSQMSSIKNIRVRGAPLAVLQGAHMPAVLIEVGYLTNPAEEKNLRNKGFLMNLAAEIGRAIDDFLTQADQNE